MQTQDALEISGKLTLSELVRFQYLNCFRRTLWIVALATLVAVLLPLGTGFDALVNPEFKLSSWNVPVLTMLFWGAILTAPYRGSKRLMQTNAAHRDSMTYAFWPDAIRCRGSLSSSEIAYPAIWMVRETKTQYLVYLNAHSALILPKRYFKDAAQQNAWRAFIEEKISPKTIEPPGFLARRL